jgi:hypothetical protein
MTRAAALPLPPPAPPRYKPCPRLRRCQDLSNLAPYKGDSSLSDLPRENRIPFRGRIHLLVSLDPWRLKLPLSGLDLGATGVAALMPESNETMLAAFDMLIEGASYELQIEPQTSDPEGLPPPPPARAKLVRRVKTAAGLELNFTFETMDALLLAFIEDQAATKGR